MLKRPSADDLLYSVKCFAAAMLALYISYAVALPRPFWAMMTSYIVANPLAGAVRSKAVYRASGTLIGAIAMVALVPNLVAAPELLSLAISAWIGLCLFVALLDRTPRSYLMMLAGYTAALIGFPSVSAPEQVFDTAVARVEEILLGIGCATLVHSTVFPRSVGGVLIARLRDIHTRVEAWIAVALDPDTTVAQNAPERRKLAGELTELNIMASHLPFDTSHLTWMARSVRALQERLALALPALIGLEDRLTELKRLNGNTLPAPLAAPLAGLRGWLQGEPGRNAAAVHAQLGAAVPVLRAGAPWRDILAANLLSRLQTLLATLEEARALLRGIERGDTRLPRELDALARQRFASPFHRDISIALRSAIAAVGATLSCCTFWIVSGWSQGSTAAMMAGVFASIFAAAENPLPLIRTFALWQVLSLPIGAAFLLAALQSTTSFELLVAMMAPVFIGIGCFMTSPTVGTQFFTLIIGTASSLALQDTSKADFVSFAESNLAQVIGAIVAIVWVGALRSVDADTALRRLAAAGWRDLSALAQGNAHAMRGYASRMLDRLGVLMPRLATQPFGSQYSADDALAELRLGLNILDLQALRRHAEGENRLVLRTLMGGLRRHFDARRADPTAVPDPALLDTSDRAMTRLLAMAPTPERDRALTALTGLRRSLFAAAPDFTPSAQEAAGP